MNINIRIISKSEELPQMECQNFFHSTDMFKIIEQTPHHHPYMIIASRADGSIAAPLADQSDQHSIHTVPQAQNGEAGGGSSRAGDQKWRFDQQGGSALDLVSARGESKETHRAQGRADH